MQKESPKFNNELNRSKNIANMNFSTRDDYQQYFIQQGLIKDGQNPWDNDDLVTSAQRHWHTRGQNGCVFAQIAATKATEIGWVSNVIRENSELSYGSKIDLLFDEAVVNKDVQNLSLIFPEIVTPNQLVNTIKDIRDTSKKVKVYDTSFDDYTVLALRGELGDDVLSWIVGFGPFDFLPLTRQSPMTELAIRTKLKPNVIFHKLNQDKEAAHLADIQLGLNDEMMDILLDKTKAKTNLILEGTSRKLSSAKASFAIPTKYWET